MITVFTLRCEAPSAQLDFGRAAPLRRAFDLGELEQGVLMRWDRLLCVMCAGMLASGCVTVAPGTGPAGSGLEPDARRIVTVAPDPAQPLARESLTPVDDPTPAPPDTGGAHPTDRTVHTRQAPEAAAPAHRSPRHAHSATPHPEPAPPHSRAHGPRPHYDPGMVCAWAKGSGLDPSVVRACQQQLGR
ncbi:hypothetical protein DWB77_07023 [Streptomyces hundungensis]|uniref:Uncharacterized protein n=1 Tax=Streptomyces hundungensis TaxID=1077946 RepID=A0A387HMQ6_9ACTN|nr:hypothetical protein [Streptomyces hundungensis]AYG84809.1 hypothetical protein DWB77_07023 [Streptomyces hundungensis]